MQTEGLQARIHLTLSNMKVSTVPPQLSKQLKAKREARGLSQEQAAERLGVDKETISRWERGRNKPTGNSVIERIKTEYDISQKELDDWFVEWNSHDIDQSTTYRICGYEFLGAAGMDEEDLLERLIDIDTIIVPTVTLADEGTVEQWAPIFHASPFTWKILTANHDVVGYWHYVCLKDEHFERVKNGTLRDSELTVDMLDFPSYLQPDTSYKMYITMIGVHGAHQNPQSGNKLIKSFIRELEKATENGLFFSEIAAVAFTPQGLSLCRDFGMDHLGGHKASGRGDLAEIFHTTGKKVPQVGHLSRNAVIASAYRARFG